MARLLFVLFFVALVCCQQTWKVGTGVRSIVPLVNGTNDYVQPIPPEDCCSAGTFVADFDVGEIAVGNGAPGCHWVRDVLNARVVTIGPDPNGKIAVLVTVEVYMFLRNDLTAYFQMVNSTVGKDAYDKLIILVQGQHNHAGPDTSGLSERPINHAYYQFMLEQMHDATIDALNNMETAYLFFGQQQWYFGLGDTRDPLMQDSTLRVIKAYRNTQKEGVPIATIVNWGMHPEITLGFDPTIDPLDCAKIFPPLPTCTGEGRYFTHDYPGHLANVLKDIQGGGEVFYFNGAIGNQIGRYGPVWEVSPQYPLGNGTVLPPGAVEVGENFRMAYLIGRELAQAVHNVPMLDTASIPYGLLEILHLSFLTRVTNFSFRFGLVPQTAMNPLGDPNVPFRIGNTLREAYICNGNNPTLADCVSDNFGYLKDNVTGLPYRLGNWMESEVNYLRIGPVKFFALPVELAPELSAGLPQDFDLPSSVSKYYEEPEFHAIGADYTLPGVLSDLLPGSCTPNAPCWFLGLTQDEMGYCFPISDWRVLCYATTEDCAAAHAKGALAFADSASGTQCKQLVENQAEAENYYVSTWDYATWTLVNQTCFYGQFHGKAKDHYEETNAASWDCAANVVGAFAEILGVTPTGRYCETTCDAIGQIP